MLEEPGFGLFQQVQIAPLRSDGTLKIPASARYLLMEVGVSDFDTMDVTELPLYPNGFLIAFEPLLDKFAINLARGAQRYHGSHSRDMAVPLSRHHQRGMILPLALSPHGGAVNITVMKRAGCSSINGPVLAAARNSSGRICQEQLEVSRHASHSAPLCLNMLCTLHTVHQLDCVQQVRRTESITLEHALRLAGPLPV